ncbi:MAG: hypothetical protein KAJ86_06430, partial [Alphaproteobacteria bacterium]|nr:hypothetical protein [Alphaproteobacteria bacterium]
HGRYELGGRVFDFRMKSHVPKSLSEEFLLVDLVNNLERLAENAENVLERVKTKARSMSRNVLMKTVCHYGNVGTRKFFAEILENDTLRHAA